MQTETIHQADGVQVEKVEKEVAGKGEVTVYTINEEQANAFGVQWTQVAHFETEQEALDYVN